MNRQEFLDELRDALQGEISQAKINENINYYNSYIIEESRKGHSEEEVVQNLGNPRLIAKSILDASKAGADPSKDYETYEEPGQERTEGLHASYKEDKGWDIRYGKWKLNSWYGILLLILIVVFILFLAGSVLAFLLPVILPVLFIMMIILLINNMRR